MIAITRNHTAASKKYQLPRASPVKNDENDNHLISAVYGINPIIIIRKVNPNNIRVIFCFVVSLVVAFVFLSSLPYFFSITFCSCNDKNVDPLSFFTLDAYIITKNIDIASDTSQRANPISIIVPLLMDIVSGSASIAAPFANGFIVEPKTPHPAPSRTTAEATIVSIPAATIVAASNA